MNINGDFIYEFGQREFNNGEFNYPKGAQLLPVNGRPAFNSPAFNLPNSVCLLNNKIVVSDRFNHRIQVFDEYGKFLFKIMGFKYPDCVFENNGSIVVVDDLNCRRES